MGLKHGFVPEVGNRMKVQIDDTVVVQSQFGNLLDEGFLKLQQVDGTETVRVSGHGCSLR